MTVKTRCVTNIKKHMGEAVSREQVEAAVDAVFDMAQRDPDLTRSMAQKLKLSARKLSEQEILAAKREKLMRAQNIIAYKNLNADISLRVADGMTPANAIDTINAGSIRSNVKAGFSVDARSVARERRWLGGLLMDLRAENLLPYLTGRGLWQRADPVFDRDLAVELSIKNGGKEKPTGNAEAAKMAGVYHKYMELARTTMNKAGAFIAKSEGYIVAQTHDAVKIGRAGFEKWRDTIAPLLDDRTFRDVKDREAFFRGAYENLRTDNHMGSEGAFSGSFNGIGPGNLAKRLSEGRVFIFKDADAWLQYNTPFGIGTVQDGVLSSLKNAARSSVAMETWGTNPAAMFERVVKEQIEAAKTAGAKDKVIDRLKTGLAGRSGLSPGMRHLFEASTGLDTSVGNPRAAAIMQGVRNVTAMAKLGGMVLAQFGDLSARALTLRHNGVNMLEGVGNGVTSIFQGRGGEAARDAANLMGVGFDGLINGALARYAGVDGVPGTMTKLMATFMRVNGAAWMQDTLESGMGKMLGHNLFRFSKQTYEMLPERLLANFKRYGITSEDWDNIRTKGSRAEDGHDYIFAQSIDDPKLSDKLFTYYVDQAREGMTMGGAAERAWVTQFGPAGSLPGEVARFALQFKNFSMTYARRHLGREFARSGVDFMGVANMVAWSVLTGYLSMSAKDIAKGREPRDPTRPDTWGASFLSGGGMGIYGDFLLGEYNRFGQTIGQTAMGPTVSLASDWASIFAKIASGGLGETGIAGLGKEQDWGKLSSQTIRTAANTTPFMNLFYTRVALDYAILYNVQEALDPGAMHRLERRLKKENDQEFLVKPSSVVR
jgi:hypothetical protein